MHVKFIFVFHLNKKIASLSRIRSMMTASNGNIFRVTGPFCREFIGPRYIPLTNKGQCGGALRFSLICAWLNAWVNTRVVGDLRRHHAHYDAIVMSPKWQAWSHGKTWHFGSWGIGNGRLVCTSFTSHVICKIVVQRTCYTLKCASGLYSLIKYRLIGIWILL